MFFFLITSFQIVCFINNNLLNELYNKYNVYEDLCIDISNEDINIVTNNMMNYLKNKEKDLSAVVTINGEKKEFFSERTKLHFIDVRNLMNNLVDMSYIFLFLSIIYFVIIKYKLKESFMLIWKNYISSLKIIMAIIALLISVIIFNFNNFFITFHHLLFNNDYWILDPRFDYVISLLPELLFKDLTIYILLLFLIIVALFSIFLKTLSRLEAKSAP